ncbi:acyl-CoA dehydrogenase family protein, partial [Microbacterium sp. MYb62]|uniref:acyl-CoA dehydrogenase family protein n=1 Tax=Microbacterium sp. MYb62 TaxID=1848690 RepID=UPI000D410EF0
MTLSLEDLIGLDPLLTARERHWRDRARDFARQHIAPIIDADSEDRRFREELIPLLGEAGLLGMHLEGYGAAGAGAVSYGLACRELEAVDSSWRTFVSVQGSLAMTAIARYGSEEHKEHWLPRMARGEAVGCFALTEPQGGSDPAATATVARFDAGEWVIDGAKRWIGLASVADVAVVWAKVEDPAYGEGARAIRGFLVPTDAPGFTATPIDGKLSMRASVQCDIRLDGVRLPAEALLPGAAGLSGPFACLNEARYGIV